MELRGGFWRLQESPKELPGRPRDPSGVLQGPFLGAFFVCFDDFGVSFARAVVAII